MLRVNQQLENRVQELRFLYGIGRSVTSMQQLEQVLNRIVEAAVYLTGAEEGSIMLVDQGSGELYLRAARGMGEKNAKTFRMKIQDSIAGQVVRTGRPVMIGGINEDDSFKVTTGYFVKALLNVPLKVADRLIGVLAVNNKINTRPFSERHLSLLIALADYASIAIENARLYARLAAHVNQAEQSTRELTQKIKDRTSELQQVNEQLIKTEKLAALGYMAAGLAKEISTPIQMILAKLPDLRQQVEPTAENRQLVASLEQETLRCRQIIQNLLDLSGQREHQPKSTNLNQIIELAWTKCNQEIHFDHNLKLVRGLDPNLPEVLVDQQQVEQALFYLIRNAYQAMSVQGGTLRIISRAVGPDVQVIISDTGRGIPQEDMRHIFDPFYETSDHNYGLGLSIAHAVIGRHNGKIEVESEPGQGTTFTIHLPRQT